ncbi:balbiani ring protein 3 isoform X3 [Gallus gallus]|uniref:balbiani ring protein 3 isoform X3 n=1 Tax=Gallus gallus TaxID=9031 RepID=UPI001AE92282|nr:balbiani ring protein 3 isoform X3 [Gallus gallus]
MASAQPAPGCSLATTAESGAGVTPTASARRSAACGAVTTCACVQPKVGATEHPPRASLVVPSHPQLRIFCLPEKPGICPLSEQAAGSRCQDPCAGDGQCPGDEKCCSTRCGHVCMAPEPDKPGQCPKVRPQLTSEPCTEEDDCLHDRDCPRQEKCCFSGCAMRCSRPAREHPGRCPRAEPCWDPRRRRSNQCLDDSVCRRDEKCCNTGCTWACVAVPRESGGGASRQCAEECESDAQCPQGERCTRMGCSRVCVDIPGGRVGVCPIPRVAWGTCLDLCSFDEECPWGQKCCSNGCGHICMPASLEEHDVAVVPQHGAGRCPEQCDADTQCPRGQRCTRTSCGRVCMDMPRGENHGPALPWSWRGSPWWVPTDGCPKERSALQGGRESAPSPGAVGRAWTCAALTRSVPRARSAAAMAAATSACGYITVLHDGRTAVLWQEGAFIRGHGAVTAWRWPVPFSPSPAIKRVHAISSCL